ncbi:malonic semialdehyde reductase [Azospirillum sp. SYSU D00513]|uniref:malonic semialdehyde reductase n=1 Tax=Azospirillum sp. SYSU D00513 TaxID=2812561 RepID=UPI001A95B270|nr:malonic semialdehyde reductase [Azospirillum sp. SYSU D00513]
MPGHIAADAGTAPEAFVGSRLPEAERRLFLEARTPDAWSDRPVPLATLHRLHELVRLAPTAFNAGPARILFVTTPEARDRLRPFLGRGNVGPVEVAPVTAIIGHDLDFFEHLPRLNPQWDAAKLFRGNPALAEETAFRNGTLQGAYLILAARLLGLDAGPVSGFDRAGLDAEFFPDGRVRSNFLCLLGHAAGPPSRPRAPRLAFEEACRVI